VGLARYSNRKQIVLVVGTTLWVGILAVGAYVRIDRDIILGELKALREARGAHQAERGSGSGVSERTAPMENSWGSVVATPSTIVEAPSTPTTAAIPEPAPAVSGPSYWSHNGSVMRLLANGRERAFVYVVPRDGIAAEGVAEGSVLFEGYRKGYEYGGTARIFSRRCGAVGFPVSGSVGSDEESLVLYGRAPRLNQACQVIGWRDEWLSFQFMRPGNME
jgi:hypothetical protein